MRLSDEKITDVKEYLNRSIKVTVSSLIPQLSKYGIDLIDTIEALRQENEQLKEQINTAKIGWDTYKTYSEQLEQQTAESNKIIEAQQQEINRLEVQVEADKDLIRELNNSYINSELNLSALISDKDEQAGRLMRYDTALKQAKEALQEAWGDDGSIAVGNRILETIKVIDALLGGKEDEK